MARARFGGAVSGGWSVHGSASITGYSDLLLCEKHALKRTTHSIAADRCRSLVRNLQGCTYPAHCAATAETEAPQNKFAAVHLRTPEQSAHCKETRTVPQHLPSPAPARSAVNRTARVTTGHTSHNVLTTCTAKEERRLPPSLLPKPLFFFSTVHGALLFLQQGEKEEGGASQQRNYLYSQRKRTPTPGACRRSGVSERNRPKGGS